MHVEVWLVCDFVVTVCCSLEEESYAVPVCFGAVGLLGLFFPCRHRTEGSLIAVASACCNGPFQQPGVGASGAAAR